MKYTLDPVTIKGQEITLSVDSKGKFYYTSEAGKVVKADTIGELKKKVSEMLEVAKKEPRPNVPCFIRDEYAIDPAVYTGKYKSSFSFPYMFKIGIPGAERRDRYTRYDVRDMCLRPDLDTARYKTLLKALEKAKKDLDEFLAKNRFDPTGECGDGK